MSPDDVYAKNVPTDKATTMNKGGLTLVPMQICEHNDDIAVYTKVSGKHKKHSPKFQTDIMI